MFILQKNKQTNKQHTCYRTKWFGRDHCCHTDGIVRLMAILREHGHPFTRPDLSTTACRRSFHIRSLYQII